MFMQLILSTSFVKGIVCLKRKRCESHTGLVFRCSDRRRNAHEKQVYSSGGHAGRVIGFSGDIWRPPAALMASLFRSG